MRPLTIGKLAKESGVSVETIRFYESKGLIRRPKSGDGFRKYPLSDSVKIRFIKKVQKVGFTLNEINTLLNLRNQPNAKCCDVKKTAEDKLLEIELKCKDLLIIKRTLTELVKSCDSSDTDISECPILDCFESDEEE